MRHIRIKIKRDTNTIHNRSVPEWEIPILAFLFDDGNIENLETFEPVAGDYPEPNSEYERLRMAYGFDPQSGIPYVASVYGQAQAGVRALNKAMVQAREEEEATRPKQKRAPRQHVASGAELLS